MWHFFISYLKMRENIVNNKKENMQISMKEEWTRKVCGTMFRGKTKEPTVGFRISRKYSYSDAETWKDKSMKCKIVVTLNQLALTAGVKHLVFGALHRAATFFFSQLLSNVTVWLNRAYPWSAWPVTFTLVVQPSLFRRGGLSKQVWFSWLLICTKYLAHREEDIVLHILCLLLT